MQRSLMENDAHHFISNFIMKFVCRPDGTTNRRLLSLLDYKVPSSIKPVNGVKTSDVTVDPSRNLWLRLFIPSNDGGNHVDMPVILYFHGGGFALMSADSMTYESLSPEHKYPCQSEDGFDVLQFIENNPKFEGFPTNANLKNCFLGGDSAGGNMAHHLTVKACNTEFRNLKIIRVLAIQPGFFGEERTESEIKVVGAPFLNDQLIECFWKAFLPEGSDRDHPALNVFGRTSVDISGLNFPATIVIVGGFDPLKDWQKRYYEGLKKCGKEAYLIEYPNAFHAFYSSPELLESFLLFNELRDFMQKQSAKSNDYLSSKTTCS